MMFPLNGKVAHGHLGTRSIDQPPPSRTRPKTGKDETLVMVFVRLSDTLIW